LSDNSKQADKESRIKRLAQQAEEGKKARADYEAEGRAVREKMAKLKALRLAKEASDREAAANAPAPIKGAKKKAGKKEAVALSQWLDGEAKDGRRG
jgi:hypothetical protein